MKLINLSERKFGNWTALRRVGSRNGEPLWLGKCHCGTTRAVFGGNLRGKLTNGR